MFYKMSRAMKKNNKGFTLVELMVVVLIIGVLVAIAIPIYSNVAGSANRNTVEANLRTIDGAVAMYHAEKGSLPANIDALVAATDKYLLEKPTGPDGTTYALNATSKRAEATKSGTPAWWTASGSTVSMPVSW